MPEPGDIYAVAERFRRELLRCERATTSEMVRAYSESWKRIKVQIDKLTHRWWEAVQAGEKPAASWPFEFERLQMLQRQVEAEIGRFARFAETRIAAEQWEAVRAAARYAEQMVDAAMPPGLAYRWDRLPVEAVEDLAGFTQSGSPLRTLLDRLGPAASESIRKALISGLALGKNPREIARQARAALGGNLVRALTISRTETLRACREATRRNYQANNDVVKGWVWHAACDPRTCVMCYAMHGTKHSLEEVLDDHPNGRCAMLPETKSWDELGFEGVQETRAGVETGELLFAKLTEEQQRQVLGNAGYEAYKAGAVKLSDFVGRKQSSSWGTTRYARSLREILGASEARKWQEAAAQAHREALRGVPKTPLKTPNPRHRLEKVLPRSPAKPTNTVVESWDVVQQDIAAINRGEGERQGNCWAINGRTYGVEKGGRCYPISGPGFHVLDRVAYKALGMYNKYGLTSEAERMLDRWDCPQEARRVARAAYEAVKG
jgi:SPP1 gp7 family putative phage head morphogenesis protein